MARIADMADKVPYLWGIRAEEELIRENGREPLADYRDFRHIP